MLTVHPEHINAKPATITMVKTSDNSFITNSITSVSIKLVVSRSVRKVACGPEFLSSAQNKCPGAGVADKLCRKLYLSSCVYSARLTMLSTIPIDLDQIDKKNIDKEILRAGIIAELDAISLYEQMAALTNSDAIKASLLDVAKEEKTHVGEFQALLLQFDSEQVEELEHGKREVAELATK